MGTIYGPDRVENPKNKVKLQTVFGKWKIPANLSLVNEPIWDWLSYDDSPAMPNNLKFFVQGAQGRDPSRTNVPGKSKLGQRVTYFATHFGIYVDSYEQDVDAQLILLRLFKTGYASVFMGQKELCKFPLRTVLVVDEDGSIGAAAGTIAPLKFNNGMMKKLLMPIHIAPLEQFYVKLHWETAYLPTLASGDTIDIIACFDGLMTKGVR
jgi:hypothetical protein